MTNETADGLGRANEKLTVSPQAAQADMSARTNTALLCRRLLTQNRYSDFSLGRFLVRSGS